MERTDGETMTPAHRERLRAAGVDVEALDARAWCPVRAGLPSWWHDLGNVLYLAVSATLPDAVVGHLTTFPFRDAVIAVGSPMPWLSSLLVGGDGATVFLDHGVQLTAGEVYCGGGSAVVLHGPLIATRQAVVDARNGGSIVVGADGLWAADVYVATDDMHRLADRQTGQRLNPFGADIRVGRHVWLCKDAVVTGHVEIGEGSVVGLRSVVRGQKVPAHAVVAGVPARVVREDVEWGFDDLP